MNYDKIIVELLARIQVLEDQVKLLMSKEDLFEGQTLQERRVREVVKLKTQDIRDYIEELKNNAKTEGKATLVLKAGNIHREKHLKCAMPMVCNAMRQCMQEGDEVLHETPSGYSSTLEIEYKLNR